MPGLDECRYVSFEGVPAPRPVAATPSPGRVVAGTLPPAPGTDFGSWVLRRAGIDARGYRSRVFDRRLPSCLRWLKVPSVEAARARVEQQPELLPKILSILLIGVTGFFRDPRVFDDLRSVVLPALAARPRPPRIWSAGCSSGAELYSVAILLDEAGLLDGATLVGTDCRDEAIDSARAAEYGPSETSTLPPHYRASHFVAGAGPALRPVARLRAAVSWRTADLLVGLEPGAWDVILWRNAAIYLEAGAADPIYRQLASALVPGGFLVVGRAERPPADAGLAAAGHCLYQKPGGPNVP